MNIGSIVSKFFSEYSANTPKRLKVVDVFLAYVMLTGILEFAYCAIVGTFPFNSFLSGFISTVGTFVLAVCLRMQVDPSNEKRYSLERAYADFIVCNIILHLWVFNFLG
eukprot:TRINITY_DN3036_c0_g5_i1.p1 TRINITY_DN3036_c0_g5~~TRINITY_DN3036_c0_g5_i1.p1  ORF type:complete len:109 (+),score=27.04 TRINITY_DN3036_c0_g5_i1:85-411(+)